MRTADSAEIGQRIAEARGRVGLTQQDLATAIGVDRSALAKVETGARRVSALELARIAEALHERIEWFLEDAPQAITSRRNLQEPGAPSPLIDRVVERVARNVEFVDSHSRLGLESGVTMDRPSSSEMTEGAARLARQQLGLDDVEPVLELSSRVAQVGLLPFSLDLGNGAADGASILLRTGGVAIVNGSLQVGRRRLTLAHELGHYLFADDFTVDWRVAEPEDADRWEARIDRFARALLLPPEGLGRAWTEGLEYFGDHRTAAVKTASRYRVDMSTLARRLSELGIVARADAEKIRLVRTTKADIIEHDLLVTQELAPSELARPYEEAVLRLYRDEVVSGARAIDLLLDTYEDSDLPELRTLREGAIWDFVS